jgi:fructokinase
LPDDHPVMGTVVHALAQLMHTLVLTTAPERIIVGGGVVASRAALLARIRAELVRSLNGYVKADEIVKNLNSYIVSPALGPLAGPLGALVLAEDALQAGAR